MAVALLGLEGNRSAHHQHQGDDKEQVVARSHVIFEMMEATWEVLAVVTVGMGNSSRMNTVQCRDCEVEQVISGMESVVTGDSCSSGCGCRDPSSFVE